MVMSEPTGPRIRSTASSSVRPSTLSPSTAVMRSPGCTPARSAGRAVDRRDDLHAAVLLRDLDAEAAELALGLDPHVVEVVGRQVARMRVELGQHAVDRRLDQLLVVDLLDVVSCGCARRCRRTGRAARRPSCSASASCATSGPANCVRHHEPQRPRRRSAANPDLLHGRPFPDPSAQREPRSRIDRAPSRALTSIYRVSAAAAAPSPGRPGRSRSRQRPARCPPMQARAAPPRAAPRPPRRTPAPAPPARTACSARVRGWRPCRTRGTARGSAASAARGSAHQRPGRGGDHHARAAPCPAASGSSEPAQHRALHRRAGAPRGPRARGRGPPPRPPSRPGRRRRRSASRSRPSAARSPPGPRCRRGAARSRSAAAAASWARADCAEASPSRSVRSASACTASSRATSPGGPRAPRPRPGARAATSARIIRRPRRAERPRGVQEQHRLGRGADRLEHPQEPRDPLAVGVELGPERAAGLRGAAQRVAQEAQALLVGAHRLGERGDAVRGAARRLGPRQESLRLLHPPRGPGRGLGGGLRAGAGSARSASAARSASRPLIGRSATARSSRAAAAGPSAPAASARGRPGARRAASRPRGPPTRMTGTGLVVCAVCGSPVTGSTIVSQLPWSAVTTIAPPTSSSAATTAPSPRSTASQAVIAAARIAGVAHHVGVGEVDDDQVVAPPRSPRRAASVTSAADISGCRS